MKLYTAPNLFPNPRRVRIFLAEKGVSIPETPIDMMTGEHKSPAFLAKNPAGQIPVLELDDGRTLSETVSICRYLEALHPTPPLFGADAFARAEVDMWTRRVELMLTAPLGQFWRHAHPLMAGRIHQFTDFGESNRATAAEAMMFFNRRLQHSPFIAGADFSMADICALASIDFASFMALEPPREADALRDWHDRVSARPSASA